MKPLLAMMLILAGLFVVTGCDDGNPVTTTDDPPPEPTEIVTFSSAYLNHRFFQLDLPLAEPGGRVFDDEVLLNTIRIFQLRNVAQPSPGDLLNVAAYVDSLGYRNWDVLDFENPHLFGRVWREIYIWSPMLDPDGRLVAVDLETQTAFEEVLAVVYEVEQTDGTIVRVGDRPGLDVPPQEVTGGEGLYYRMKLLKAPVWDREPHTFGYVLRNIYSLGAANIDASTFALRIERNHPGVDRPHLDENGLDYLRIFGLDLDNPLRTGDPDGLVDFWDPYLIDLQKGLLKFPQDFPWPFAAGGNPAGRQAEADMTADAVYSGYAGTAAFVWDPSFLRGNQSWPLYDLETYPWNYNRYTAFRIITTYGPFEGVGR